MTLRSIIRRQPERALPARRRGEDDLFSLQRGINTLFDDFFGGAELSPFRAMEEGLSEFSPHVDVSETDTELTVTAELPGLDEKNVDVTLDEDAIVIKGEKKDEHEEKAGTTYRLERRYGSFHRVIPLPSPVEPSKSKATFKKGVLQVTLQKLAT